MKPSNGKIARLPNHLRDRINTMIRDCVPYKTIIETLGKPVRHINERNFTNWKKHGHKHWLKEQEQIDLMQKASNLAMAAATSNKTMVVHQASIHLVATQLKDALTQFNSKSILEALESAPENYPKLVNAIARLSEGGLRFERYHAEVAERKARIRAQLEDAQRGGLTKEHLTNIEKDLNLL